jgi:hypothetical protein
MPPIEETIADIEKLDQLRHRARTLRQQAVDALTAKPYLPQPRDLALRRSWKANPAITRDGWREPGDDVEKTMLLQRLDTRHEPLRNTIRTDLLGISRDDCYKTEDDDPPSDALDNVPIMRCAMVLQGLTADGCALKAAALACFSRIVVELAEVSAPTRSVGGARASKAAMASAFITGECGLALLALKEAMHYTAEAADLIEAERTSIAALRPDVPVWREQELARRAMTLYTSLSVLRPRLVVKLPDDALTPLRKLGLGETAPATAAALNASIAVLQRTVEAALADIPVADTLLRPDPGSPAITDPPVKILTDHLTTAAHHTVRDIVAGLVDALNNTAAPAAGETRVGRNLRDGERIVTGLLEPIARFAESTIERELARPRLGLAVEGAELVFAACLLGRISGWQQPKVRSAFELARQLLTSDGHLPGFQAFNVRRQGYRLTVATLEVTRRLSELAGHVALEIAPAFVETLMRPLEDTRAPGRDDKQRGWMTDPRGREAKSEWWVTALAVDALDMLIAMLDAQINQRVLEQFHVRRPAEIALDLGQLFSPDYGLSALRSDRPGWKKSVAVKLQELRIHAEKGAQEQDQLHSLVLYGPPGTGKTTLVEAVANSAGVPLVEITPSDILVGGEEAIERRTRHVFLALSMLTHAVILFDEFDPILQNRGKRRGDEPAKSIFEFLTPGMLPKLKRLHDSAKTNRTSYVLATNFFYNLDPAAIRQGRFDAWHGIYPPDAISRLGRLLDQKSRQTTPPLNPGDAEAELRVLQAVANTRGSPMDRIAKPGWYTAKRFSEGFRDGSLFFFLEAPRRSMDEVQPEAAFDGQWREFYTQQTERPDMIRAIMSEREKQYWDDWSAIDHWDQDLADAINAPGLASVDAMLTDRVRTRRGVDAPAPPAPAPP